MTQLLLGKQGPSTVCRPDHSNTLREREGECEVQQYVGGLWEGVATCVYVNVSLHASFYYIICHTD